MKILTLNTHSLREADYEIKLAAFVEFILRERPDIIAMQEVNQSAESPIARDCRGMVKLPESRIPLRADNHALQVADILEDGGIAVSWTYLPIKLGYGRYDEGIALMCLNGSISDTDTCTISRRDDYLNWRTRKALGVRTDNHPEWFYTVHMGWWHDEEEPFSGQWDILNRRLGPAAMKNRVWLMGDFNAPAEVRNEGYDLISHTGWKDTFFMAEKRDEGHTVRGAIDGWRGMISENSGMRIDHIWCSQSVPVKTSKVVFDGAHEPVISDHFGVMIETKGEP